MITAAQIRMARGALEWSQQRLIEETGLSPTTIKRMENDTIGPGRSASDNVEKVIKALESAGVEFIPTGSYQGTGGPGVRLRGRQFAERGASPE